jgi:hypothetical protein
MRNLHILAQRCDRRSSQLFPNFAARVESSYPSARIDQGAVLPTGSYSCAKDGFATTRRRPRRCSDFSVMPGAVSVFQPISRECQAEETNPYVRAYLYASKSCTTSNRFPCDVLLRFIVAPPILFAPRSTGEVPFDRDLVAAICWPGVPNANVFFQGHDQDPRSCHSSAVTLPPIAWSKSNKGPDRIRCNIRGPRRWN